MWFWKASVGGFSNSAFASVVSKGGTKFDWVANWLPRVANWVPRVATPAGLPGQPTRPAYPVGLPGQPTRSAYPACLPRVATKGGYQGWIQEVGADWNEATCNFLCYDKLVGGYLFIINLLVRVATGSCCIPG